MNNELSILLHLKLFINLFNTWGTDKNNILTAVGERNGKAVILKMKKQ